VTHKRGRRHYDVVHESFGDQPQLREDAVLAADEQQAPAAGLRLVAKAIVESDGT
jgi:hypothetical protein